MKRFCQTLTLVNDEKIIAEYVEAHKHVWPEVIDGQRKVGDFIYGDMAFRPLALYDLRHCG